MVFVVHLHTMNITWPCRCKLWHQSVHGHTEVHMPFLLRPVLLTIAGGRLIAELGRAVSQVAGAQGRSRKSRFGTDLGVVEVQGQP